MTINSEPCLIPDGSDFSINICTTAVRDFGNENVIVNFSKKSCFELITELCKSDFRLLDDSDKPRLYLAKRFFTDLNDSVYVGLLKRYYNFWRWFDEWHVLKRVITTPNNEDVDYLAVLSSKRGNEAYFRRLEKKFRPLRDIKDKDFEYFEDIKRNVNGRTQLLFVTLTYNSSLRPVNEAWVRDRHQRFSEKQNKVVWITDGISSEYNRYVSNLRRKYGKISVLRVFEATREGYPHVHLILYFHDKSFKVFWKNGKYRVYGIKNEDSPFQNWHSFVDVQGVRTLKECCDYIVKYVTKDYYDYSEKGQLGLVMNWLFGKQSYSVSRDFFKSLKLDLINPNMHNSNSVVFQSELFSCKVQIRYFYLGMVHYDFPVPRLRHVWKKLPKEVEKQLGLD